MAKFQPKIEQKVIRIDGTHLNKLDKELKDGWVIKQITAAGLNFNDYCWILLEKTVNL